ncbi:MAG: hypothetical protein GY834_05985 [Bacteroidetes bacterium]|nr:hypothetical protein [Bacteroidota bacterium]
MAETTTKQQLIDLWEDRNKKEYSWMRQVLPIISIILGLTISLKSDSANSMTEFILFTTSISLNVICILSGLLYLYSEPQTAHSLVQKYTRYIIFDYPESDGGDLVAVRPHKIFYISRICFLICLVLSFLALLAYGIVQNYPCEIL